jgi:hypothetical protein
MGRGVVAEKGEGPKMGQLATGRRPAWMGIRYHVQRANIPSKRFFV